MGGVHRAAAGTKRARQVAATTGRTGTGEYKLTEEQRRWNAEVDRKKQAKKLAKL